jgi:hypothetical protein
VSKWDEKKDEIRHFNVRNNRFQYDKHCEIKVPFKYRISVKHEAELDGNNKHVNLEKSEDEF